MKTSSNDNQVPTVSPEEKLRAASEKYMSGGMSVEDLAEAKRKYAPYIYKETKKSSLLGLVEEVTARLFS